MRNATIFAAALLTTSLQAWAVAPPGFAVAGRTPRLTVYARPGQKVDVQRVDTRLAELERQLDTVARPARYFHHERPEDVAAATGRFASGVTFSSGEVHATDRASDHELVHVVSNDLGRPGAFFEEGLAVVLGDECRYRGEKVDKVAKLVAPRLPLTQIMARFDERQPGTGYAVAGSFVQHLVSSYGLPKLVQFFRATWRNTTDAAFLQVYGRTLDEEGELWQHKL